MKMDSFTLLVFALAVWRMSGLLTQDTGPFKMFRRLRERFGIEHTDAGDIHLIPDGYFAELLSCMWCSSLALSIIFFILYLAQPLVIYFLYPFAIGGLALVINRHAK